MNSPNRDEFVIEGFGREWSTFDQSGLTGAERAEIFQQYFSVFPWDRLPRNAVGADIGCGSGRWATLVAPRVGRLHCVDPSAEALDVAARNLVNAPNVELHQAGVGDLPFEPASLDFAYSLGVLHHVPDTAAALRACARVLKPGAPFLVYLYYAFDNQPWWYRSAWRATDLLRRVLSVSSFRMRLTVSTLIAVGVYWPLARMAKLAERLGKDVSAVPLSYYRDRSLYVMRNDALDRFGTSLEHRFSREQVRVMLADAGLEDVRFSEHPPFWTAVGTRA